MDSGLSNDDAYQFHTAESLESGGSRLVKGLNDVTENPSF